MQVFVQVIIDLSDGRPSDVYVTTTTHNPAHIAQLNPPTPTHTLPHPPSLTHIPMGVTRQLNHYTPRNRD
ncbi:hypothetical protein E2C01_060483 [Portunus trituberculatus]|uniref:Uncharacterized protein n=1 Tax=Portunus trituberculatus TaxID=210409 RepID=A0A5B7H9K2_PORTR|nr:hypothetical protein [Portunus trituberculatus]